MYAKELVSACFFLPFYAAITIQFEQDMYMVQESEGMIDIRVVTSGRTSFDYTFTVTSMDITAMSKYILAVFNSSENYINSLINVQVIAEVNALFLYSLPLLYTDTLDYIFSPTTFQLQPAADNEPIPSTVLSISIIRDPDNEFNETFQLTIEVSDEAGASKVTEGVISMTVVLIKDDDGKTITQY